jgi:teichuronic acid biosynthesis glycosyltransferase TuaG
VLIKREVALDYPMEKDDAHEDYLAWLRLLKDYKFVTGVDQPLLKYRVNKNSKSANKFKSAAMTYRTYLYAGYDKKQAMKMMVSYVYYGIKKYI